MPPDDPLDRLLDDLEGQAEGLYLADRAAEVAELRVAQYAEVAVVARWHASLDRTLRIAMIDGWILRGRLARVGADWAHVVEDAGRAWVLNVRHLTTVSGLADRTLPPEARPLAARLSLGSVLRRLAEAPGPVVARVVGGAMVHGSVRGVGADFVELEVDADERVVVPFRALVAVQVTPVGE
jgi:hypothetical protein